MLLFFAFLCFALLLTGWIVAPTSAPPADLAPSNVMPEPHISPA